MVLKWISASRDSDDVSELIARKKYGRAIEVLREQFKLRPPGVQTRLQFVDVLILAGRGKEAVPILVGLADELAADGFTSKAIALLKRVERIEPRRADVEALMARLVMDQPLREISHVPSVAVREAAGTAGFDLEEIEEAAQETGRETDAEPASGVEPEAEPALPETAPPQPTELEVSVDKAGGGAEPGEVKSQIRGAFRRFLESLDEEGGAAAPGETPRQGAVDALLEAPAEPEVGTPGAAGVIEESAAAAGPGMASAVPEVAPAALEPKSEKRRRAGFLRRLFGGGDEEETAPAVAAEAREAPAPAGVEEPLTTAEIEAVAEAGPGPEAELEAAAAPLAASVPVVEVVAPVAGGEEGPLAIAEIEAVAEAAPHEMAPAETVEREGEPPFEAREEPGPAVTVEPEMEPAVEPEIEPTVEPESALVAEGIEAPREAEPPVMVEPEVEATPEPAIEGLSEPSIEIEPAATPSERPEAYLRQLLATSEEGGLDEAGFQDRVLDLIEEVLQQPVPRAEISVPEPEPSPAAPVEAEPAAPPAPVRTRGVQESAQQLAANPLLRDLSDEERLAVVRGMRLHTYEAGDVVATEGEPGDSVFTVIAGAVRVFVKSPAGHNFETGVLREGEFFGEISSLSGRPRTSTVVATTHTELLELDRDTVERIARRHPRVREILESAYLQRASSPEAAAIRAVPIDPASRQRAIEVLEAYFGESRWDPRMRLRLADLLVRTGKEDDAVPLLVGLAEDLERAGYPEKAVAILKKIERIRKRNIEEVNIAPLSRKKAEPRAKPAPAIPVGDVTQPVAPRKAKRRSATQAHFESWIVDVVRDAVKPAASEPAAPVLDREGPVYARGLRASPLFEGLSEEELLAVIREFRLLSFDPGDIILTEGEPGQSLFILTAGSVRVHIRNARGHNVFLTELREGAFFGEMAVVSGKPRTATITARERCELLELDKASLDRIAEGSPRVRERIEEAYISRASSAQAASIRTRPTRS